MSTYLAARITSVLEASGFTATTRTSSGRSPEFAVSEGVGATVVLSWDASGSDRADKFDQYADAIAADGLTVDHRGNYLYVHQPSHLESCGCLRNDAGAPRAGCPDHPEGVRGA